MALRQKKDDRQVPWVAMTDLSIGLFALFVFAFIALWFLKDKVSADYTRKEDEFQTCVNEKRKAEQSLKLYDRMLGEKLKIPIQKGLLSVSDGRIDIQAALLFPPGGAGLAPEGQELIRSVREAFTGIVQEDTTFMLMVAGYTDSLPVMANVYATNWELSAARAMNVVQALIRLGFPPNRLFSAGFGEHHPRASNATESGRAQNRRVEITRVPMNANKSAWVVQ